MVRKKTGVVPYGWEYFPGKQCLTKINYAIEPISDRYVAYKKNRTAFKELKKRFETLREKYEKNNDAVREMYQNTYAEVIGIEFWKEYLW